jgi:hypothetical protein
MRAHGVPNFPDPGANGRLEITATPGSTALLINGTRVSGPAFAAAQRACRSFLPGAGGPPPKISAAQRARILAFAKCMREHGVPNFPDPVFGHGFVKIAGGPSGINPTSPVFQHAQKACGLPFFRTG